MKKVLATLGVSVIVAGAAVTHVSAEEYNVQKGDSLWDIANEYNTTVDDLVEINDLDSKIIQPDQKLSVDNQEKETYKVKSGDTLNGISKQFDVTVEEIKDWNDLDSDLIIVGQKLALGGVSADQGNSESSDNAQVPAEEGQASADNNQSSGEEAQAPADNEQSSNEDTQNTGNNEAAQSSNQSEPAQSDANSDDAPEGKTVSVSATAYTAQCDGCSGVTSTGVDLSANPDAKVIAVDPDVIPLGSEVYVEGYGKATAADIGGAINGNKIDVHVADEGEANNWGVKNVDVTILD